LSSRVFREKFRENYSRFGIALLPLALTGFMAFHFYYLVNLGIQLPMLLSRNFDVALFRQLVITVPSHAVLIGQQIIIAAGFVWTLVTMYRIGRAANVSAGKALFGMAPHAVAAVVLATTFMTFMRQFFFAS
ncbi:MAG TPA: DNA-binding protein, partial [Desulfomonilaceae bacterium]|nr:DNA-binding protein [Desulfomonilaceae bacterium]